MLPGKGEDVRAAGRLEGFGLLGSEAIFDSEDQGLQEACRTPPDPGQRPSAGIPNGASGPIDPTAPVDGHDVARPGEENRLFRLGAGRSSRPDQGSGVDRSSPTDEDPQGFFASPPGIGELGRDAAACEAQTFDTERICTETVSGWPRIRGQPAFGPRGGDMDERYGP